MIEKPLSGRTPADAIVEIVSTWRVLFLFLITVLIMFLTVHFSAEPGTQVEFLGVITYQKAKPVLPPPPAPIKPVIDETLTYFFPENEPIHQGSQKAIPILDGTLAVVPIWQGAAGVVGTSIEEISVGSRRPDGIPQEVYQEKETIKFWGNIWLEIEYRGKVFALKVIENKEKRGELFVTVTKIPKATLKLKKVKDLPYPSYEN